MPSSRPQFVRLSLLALAVCFAARTPSAADFLDQQLDQIRGQFHSRLEKFARICDSIEALKDQAATTRALIVERHAGYQYLFPPPEDDRFPKGPAGRRPSQLFAAVKDARQKYAARLMGVVKSAIESGRLELVYRLAAEAHWADPQNRFAARVTAWEEPVRRVSAGRTKHPRLGWAAGDYWRIETNHYSILTNHSPEEGRRLADQLEALHALWRQVYVSYWADRPLLAARLIGRAGRTQDAKHRVVQFAGRDEYVDYFTKSGGAEIRITHGVYLPKERACFFYAGDRRSRSSIDHEASHQLFQETGATTRDVGAKNNFWLVEGVAMYMESLRRVDHYYTVGGQDAERLQHARMRLLNDQFFVPLSKLSGLGREEVQKSKEIRSLYVQSGGMTHLLMDGSGGRFRPAVMEALKGLYTDSATPDALRRAAGVSYEKLDTLYREFLRVEDADLAVMAQRPGTESLLLGRTDVTDQGVMHLARVKSLWQLDLSFSDVTDASVRKLWPLKKLEYLALVGTKISDDSLFTIGEMPKLTILDLSLTGVTDKGIAELSQLKTLKKLRLVRTQVSDQAIKRLKKAIPGLQVEK